MDEASDFQGRISSFTRMKYKLAINVKLCVSSSGRTKGPFTGPLCPRTKGIKWQSTGLIMLHSKVFTFLSN